MLSSPPFRLASAAGPGTARPASGLLRPDGCCSESASEDAPAMPGRIRFADLDQHLHCSVLGTCLSTAELRKLMARFIDVHGASELSVHHDAVAWAGDARVGKALHKALDQRHDAVVQRFAKVRDPGVLETLWEEALRHGEVPGAYWAVISHRHAGSELRQRVFGDVHMLSHLVGAANRADIRRLVAIEKENADLLERLERQQRRIQQLCEARDAAVDGLQRNAFEASVRPVPCAAAGPALEGAEALTALVALQTDRRERAEAAAAAAHVEAGRLQRELDYLREQANALGRELAAAEVQLREGSGPAIESESARSLAPRLKDRRILYVGGRPSSTPAIRDLVQRHGGEFQKHDGGLEDRKGLLESAVAWAEFVLFPVDCIDHDSAGRLKRTCTKLGTPFVPLRTASVASFAAAVAELDDSRSTGTRAGRPTLCMRHG